MKKLIVNAILSMTVAVSTFSQHIPAKFGQGLRFEGVDNTYYLKLGLRFQNLAVAEWSSNEDETSFEGTNFLVRRSRIKADGWALTPKIKYKLELSLSNRDVGGGDSDEFGNTANIILDAHVTWNFFKNWSIQFGQGKLPGNRERVISSGSLQLVDRSRLNSRFTLDRDLSFTLKHTHKISSDFVLKETIAVSSGEGKNIITQNEEGYGYTARLDVLPFGEFHEKGDYIGGALYRETTPKLAIGLTYDLNQNALRERGQKGSFIQDESGNYYGKDLSSVHADLMFKYQGFSLMMEYAYREAEDSPFVFADDGTQIGKYYTGQAFNAQAGIFLTTKWEVAARYTSVLPEEGVSSNETHYTLGLSRYVVGHKLKVQSDISYADIESGDNQIYFRLQAEVHL